MRPAEQYRLLDVARAADELGVDFVDTTDHVLMGLGALTPARAGSYVTSISPSRKHWSLLAAMAGATRRINVLSGIVIAPLRPAGCWPKWRQSARDLARPLRHGRHRQLAERRVRRPRRVLRAARTDPRRHHRRLSRAVGSRASQFSFADGQLRRHVLSPRPAAGERIPVWFGGKFTPRQIRRIVELGDGWMLYGGLGMTLEQKARSRSPPSASVSSPPAATRRRSISATGCRKSTARSARSMEQVPAMAEAGVNVIRVHLRRFTKPRSRAAHARGSGHALRTHARRAHLTPGRPNDAPRGAAGRVYSSGRGR